VPTVGFQRVLQRSVYQAQSAQKNTTSSSDSGERVEIASMTSRREMLLSFNK
jgi:hypothetical protein